MMPGHSSVHDPDDESIDINLRPAAEVAHRAVALISLARRGLIEQASPVDRQSDDFYALETDRFDLYSWAQSELREALTGDERRILAAPTGTLGIDHVERCIDALISAEALCWSLSVIDALPEPAHPTEARISRMLEWAPEPWDTVGRIARESVIRTVDEIARERERREIWYWRTSLDPADFESDDRLRSIIVETAREAELAGHIQVAENDFALQDTPLVSLSADQMAEIEHISRIQLHALNWVSGFGESWDATPLFPE